uniref:non-specific serine/threonine protein kinase n=1 Tax=Picea sitchensis TaxID=3332 RepID=A9NVC0_PICSI|nr:unknown [Picea sitchensis]
MLIRWRSLVLITFTFLALPLIPAQPVEDPRHTSFLFDGFNGTNLILETDASVIGSKSVLALTNRSHANHSHEFLLGRALYSIPVQMKSNETISSFSTTFVFSIVPPPSNAGGNGIAFFMTPHTSSMDAQPSQYLGLLNLTTNGQAYNHLFAVEFDTIMNVEFNDPDGNHVGVDVNNLVSVQTETAGYWNGEEFHELNLRSGRNIQAWIDYDHLQSRLDVTMTVVGLPRPQKPLISLQIDLHNVLQEKMYVGFSAATGLFMEDHYVLAWSFTTQGTAPPLDVSCLRSFANMYTEPLSRGFTVGVTVASLVLFLLAIAAAVFLKRVIKRETIEEWEEEYWPHRFTYKELSIATSRFRDENVLGYGGFGMVYKGVLPSSGQEVAVKCITTEFTEGMKGFVAEISSMGRLRHRNLVQLRGWCRRHTQLFIVYDYMPNGSLDKLIFGNPTTVLPWHRRYAILKGVAAGLLYLHEQWEKRVVHRDIKSSNVLLDSELNGRLGDFGLARLYDHAENPETTHVVGTLGYIAPELIQTGKATPSSDVFSFGVLLLEVACGRNPVDSLEDSERMILAEWAWELYTEGRLLEASDPKLAGKGGYDVGEMEKVLKLGLLCSHPEPESRLGMRHVCQILDGEAPIPYGW